jgi:hypothetical protein
MLTLESKELEEYFNKGFYLFPCHYITKKGICSCHKGAECGQPGKHPMISGWKNRATNDFDEFSSFGFEKFNLGLPTGKLNNLEVIDVDKKNNGFRSLKKVMKDNNLYTPLAIQTGGDGIHLYYQYSDKGLKNVTDLLPGIDIRTEGGYVIAPGSNHLSGSTYKVIENFSLDKITGEGYAN